MVGTAGDPNNSTMEATSFINDVNRESGCVGGGGGGGGGDDSKTGSMASPPNSTNNSAAAITTNNNTTTPTTSTNTSKAAAQMQKMRDANTKYKNLLKMAKERIEQQEVEIKKFRENERKRLDEETMSRDSGDNNNNYIDDANDDLNYWNLVRVSQRIRVDLGAHDLNTRGLNEEIWALIEWERDDKDRDMIDNNGQQQQQPSNNNNYNNNNNKKKVWKRFDSESELTDFIRRDTGEPLTLPPYSLTPQQSSRTTAEADKKVTSITEEYRRFRVKSEMTRKKMDAQIRDLQSSNVETTKRQIEGRENVEQEMEATRRTEHNQLKRMRADAARQEEQWKEAYDIILKENEALKSSGSDAILASQWRQRYEACLKEKEEAVHKNQSIQQRNHSHQLQQSSASFSSPPNVRGGGGNKNGGQSSSQGKYELKYRDLKESFRLYRKKAKEVFESQQAAAAATNSNSNSFGGSTRSDADMMMLQMSQQNPNNAEEDSKLSYLKNLLVKYLTSDPEFRDHMENAIGTVLKFTPDDIAAIEKKKTDEASWGLF
eukprot:CAMPEP_0170787750 /NCGR_PEP_ID=MMETSP0733-20121128/18470_1 /TAXON_ID=186038 /ORGANISM="Fragilariopsis kerguelensis, Strain L26-C5" /LENGTH=544 /DNA_ID=CAMNT_0011134019 /DNA_START=147 /DNA_END=1781 /DNA_ORIENTATION=-